MKTYTEDQILRAEKIAKTSPLSLGRILEIVAKDDLKKGWKPMSKKHIEQQNIRNSEKETTGDIAEMLLQNAKNNLPSSMR